MRLFNIKTLKLEYFQNVDVAPPYAILSHRWEEEEVLFRDVVEEPHNQELEELKQRFQQLEERFDALQRQLEQKSTTQRPLNTPSPSESQKDKHPESTLALSHPHLRHALVKKGWQKVEGFCRVAKRLGLSYAWVDTFCIDQSSSSELSESINSMFAWYQNAKVCIAYLYDVIIKGDSWDYNHYEGVFDNSSWFRRGWTLQELIAPKEIWFFKKDWSLYGVRSELADQISEITKIDKVILCEPTIENLNKFSVAARLSWAAGRITTRREDRAYSLMGLFGVNIPTIYGEGQEAAFFRLQSEIFQKTSDHSIFAWKPSTDSVEAGLELFAQSPDAFDFDGAGAIISVPYDSLGLRRKVATYSRQDAIYSSSSHRMRVQILLHRDSFTKADSVFRACLACRFRNSKKLIVIRVLSTTSGEYLRLPRKTEELEVSHFEKLEWGLADVYISPHPLISQSQQPTKESVIPRWLMLNDTQLIQAGFEMKSSWLWRYSDNRDGKYLITRGKPFGAVTFRNGQTGDAFGVVLKLSPTRLMAVITDDLHNFTYNEGLVVVSPKAVEAYPWQELGESIVNKTLGKYQVYISSSKSSAKELKELMIGFIRTPTSYLTEFEGKRGERLQSYDSN